MLYYVRTDYSIRIREGSFLSAGSSRVYFEFLSNGRMGYDDSPDKAFVDLVDIDITFDAFAKNDKFIYEIRMEDTDLAVLEKNIHGHISVFEDPQIPHLCSPSLFPPYILSPAIPLTSPNVLSPGIPLTSPVMNSVPPASVPKQCQCGAESCGYSFHSSWCPKY